MFSCLIQTEMISCKQPDFVESLPATHILTFHATFERRRKEGRQSKDVKLTTKNVIPDTGQMFDLGVANAQCSFPRKNV